MSLKITVDEYRLQASPFCRISLAGGGCGARGRRLSPLAPPSNGGAAWIALASLADLARVSKASLAFCIPMAASVSLCPRQNITAFAVSLDRPPSGSQVSAFPRLALESLPASRGLVPRSIQQLRSDLWPMRLQMAFRLRRPHTVYPRCSTVAFHGPMCFCRVSSATTSSISFSYIALFQKVRESGFVSPLSVHHGCTAACRPVLWSS